MNIAEFRALTAHLDESRIVLIAMDEYGNQVKLLGDISYEIMEEDRHGNINLADDLGQAVDPDEDDRPLGVKQSRCLVLWPTDDKG